MFLSAPIRTNHPFFQQPNEFRHAYVRVEDLIEKSGARWTILRPGPLALNWRNWWAPQIRNGDVVRWLSAYAAAVGRPALVTSTIEESTGTAARAFREYTLDYAADFARV